MHQNIITTKTSQTKNNGFLFVRFWSTFSILVALVFSLYFTTPTEAATTLGVTNSNIVTNGLVGHWTFDGKNMTNTTALDISGNSNTGTLTNMTAWSGATIGRLGQALRFDGVDDYISVANNANLNGSQGTWLFWIKKGGTPSGNGYVSLGKTDVNGSYNGMNFYHFSSSIGIQIKGASDVGSYATTFGSLADSKWHHVAVSYISGGALRIYFDGSLVVSTTSPTFTISSQPLRFGRSVDTYWETYKGSIDDVRIYNRILSASEIQSIYKAGGGVILAKPIDSISIGTNSGLVGHWTFDGKNMTNATATDSSVNRYNGTLVSMTTRVNATIGKIGQGLRFRGDSWLDSINLGTGKYAFTKTTTFSGSAWVKPSTAGTIMGNFNLNVSPGWIFQTGSNGVIRFSLSDASAFTGGRSVTNSTNIIDGKWHHVAFTYDGSNTAAGIKLYVDGRLESIATTSDADPGTLVDSGFRIGAFSFFGVPAAHFDGTLDDVRLYNRVLSAKEIQSLYKAGGGVTIKPSSPNLATIKSLASFTCGTSNVTDVDGNVYNTVAIGSQCWMKQSLRTGTRINVSTAQTNNGTIEKYCYSDTASNCTSNDPNQPDGGLYQWNEAMQYSTTPGARGICPSGWHIPTHDQLTTMERNICTSGSCATDFPYDTSTSGYRGTNEGTKLKPNGTSALEVNLAGYSYSGSFLNRGSYGVLWSSSESGADAWCRYVNSGSAQVTREANDKSGGLSVRCLKD